MTEEERVLAELDFVRREVTGPTSVKKLDWAQLRGLLGRAAECLRSRAANARRFEWLMEQVGSFQDGSETTVTLLSDDATRTRCVKVGERYHGVDARTFESVIDEAMRSETPVKIQIGPLDT